MYIKTIIIEGFKSYTNKCIVEVGDQLNFVTDESEFGKTDLIEAIKFLLDPNFQNVTLEYVRAKDFPKIKKAYVQLHILLHKGEKRLVTNKGYATIVRFCEEESLSHVVIDFLFRLSLPEFHSIIYGNFINLGSKCHNNIGADIHNRLLECNLKHLSDCNIRNAYMTVVKDDLNNKAIETDYDLVREIKLLQAVLLFQEGNKAEQRRIEIINDRGKLIACNTKLNELMLEYIEKQSKNIYGEKLSSLQQQIIDDNISRKKSNELNLNYALNAETSNIKPSYDHIEKSLLLNNTNLKNYIAALGENAATSRHIEEKKSKMNLFLEMDLYSRYIKANPADKDKIQNELQADATKGEEQLQVVDSIVQGAKSKLSLIQKSQIEINSKSPDIEQYMVKQKELLELYLRYRERINNLFVNGVKVLYLEYKCLSTSYQLKDLYTNSALSTFFGTDIIAGMLEFDRTFQNDSIDQAIINDYQGQFMDYVALQNDDMAQVVQTALINSLPIFIFNTKNMLLKMKTLLEKNKCTGYFTMIALDTYYQKPGTLHSIDEPDYYDLCNIFRKDTPTFIKKYFGRYLIANDNRASFEEIAKFYGKTIICMKTGMTVSCSTDVNTINTIKSYNLFDICKKISKLRKELYNNNKLTIEERKYIILQQNLLQKTKHKRNDLQYEITKNLNEIHSTLNSKVRVQTDLCKNYERIFNLEQYKHKMMLNIDNSKQIINCLNTKFDDNNQAKLNDLATEIDKMEALQKLNDAKLQAILNDIKTMTFKLEHDTLQCEQFNDENVFSSRINIDNDLTIKQTRDKINPIFLIRTDMSQMVECAKTLDTYTSEEKLSILTNTIQKGICAKESCSDQAILLLFEERVAWDEKKIRQKIDKLEKKLCGNFLMVTNIFDNDHFKMVVKIAPKCKKILEKAIETFKLYNAHKMHMELKNLSNIVTTMNDLTMEINNTEIKAFLYATNVNDFKNSTFPISTIKSIVLEAICNGNVQHNNTVLREYMALTFYLANCIRKKIKIIYLDDIISHFPQEVSQKIMKVLVHLVVNENVQIFIVVNEQAIPLYDYPNDILTVLATRSF